MKSWNLNTKNESSEKGSIRRTKVQLSNQNLFFILSMESSSVYMWVSLTVINCVWTYFTLKINLKRQESWFQVIWFKLLLIAHSRNVLLLRLDGVLSSRNDTQSCQSPGFKQVSNSITVLDGRGTGWNSLIVSKSKILYVFQQSVGLSDLRTEETLEMNFGLKDFKRCSLVLSNWFILHFCSKKCWNWTKINYLYF